MTRRPPVVLRLPREALYAAIVVLFLFTTTEIVLRVDHAATQARRGARPYSVRSVTHDGRSWTDGDGQIALATDPHLVYRPAGGQRGAQVTINERGFRGREWPEEKAAGTKRVVVLGGSTAFGVGASGDEQVFTAVLERLLQERLGGAIEVLNAGVIGYDSDQELVLLATELVDVESDLVVCFDGWNDFHESGRRADPERALLHPKFEEIDRELSRRSQPFTELLRRLALVRALEDGMARRLRKLASGEFGEYHDQTAVALPRYQRNLRAIVRLAREYGAATLLAPQPELFQRRDPPPAELEMRRKKEKDGYGGYSRAAYGRFVATARAVASAEAAAFADCTTAFDADPELVFTDFVHLDDHGNELLARFLLPAVAAALGR